MLIRTHSEIVGPWIPEEVVMGISVSVKRGWETKWSMPAERRWIRWRLATERWSDAGKRGRVLFWGMEKSSGRGFA